MKALENSLPEVISENMRAGDSFTFAQVCDPQLGMGGYEHDVESFEQAVCQINEIKPDFVLLCGDLVDRPDASSFNDINRLMSEFQVPYFCVPGNHDLLHGAYDEEVGQNKNTSLNNYRRAIGEDYYRFEHKGVCFVCVNTQLWFHVIDEESKKHNDWLLQTLQDCSNKNMPVMVVGHHPLYLESPEEEDQYFNIPKEKRLEILKLFEQHRVWAMLSGHTHRMIFNSYQGVQLVAGETTSVNFRSTPLGFRIWEMEGQPPFHHYSVPLKLEGNFEEIAD